MRNYWTSCHNLLRSDAYHLRIYRNKNFMFSLADCRALISIQQSLKILDQWINDENNVHRDQLADIWNALIESRSSIIDKMFNDEVMSFADLHGDIGRFRANSVLRS